jgi:hypothetical protein
MCAAARARMQSSKSQTWQIWAVFAVVGGAVAIQMLDAIAHVCSIFWTFRLLVKLDMTIDCDLPHCVSWSADSCAVHGLNCKCEFEPARTRTFADWICTSNRATGASTHPTPTKLISYPALVLHFVWARCTYFKMQAQASGAHH